MREDHISQIIKNLMIEQGVSPKLLAERMGMSMSTVYKVLSPKAEDVLIETLDKAAHALNHRLIIKVVKLKVK